MDGLGGAYRLDGFMAVAKEQLHSGLAEGVQALDGEVLLVLLLFDHQPLSLQAWTEP